MGDSLYCLSCLPFSPDAFAQGGGTVAGAPGVEACVAPLPSAGPSEDVFDEGRAADFVAGLADEARDHRGVCHPYLKALSLGALPDLRWALRDFARHYTGYSSHFSRYLAIVIARLDDPAHRNLLLQNLTEESGAYAADELRQLAAQGIAPEWVEGVPHSQLFVRFSEALGVVRGNAPEAGPVTRWRELFLKVLTDGSPAEALGALGLGTEGIVRTIYKPFVDATQRLGDLAPRDTVFFPLHTTVDDHHQASLQAISCRYAVREEGRKGLRRGMLRALELRSGFWDWLLPRALDPQKAEPFVGALHRVEVPCST